LKTRKKMEIFQEFRGEKLRGMFGPHRNEERK
jgi:hypothetical protein